MAGDEVGLFNIIVNAPADSATGGGRPADTHAATAIPNASVSLTSLVTPLMDLVRHVQDIKVHLISMRGTLEACCKRGAGIGGGGGGRAAASPASARMKAQRIFHVDPRKAIVPFGSGPAHFGVRVPSPASNLALYQYPPSNLSNYRPGFGRPYPAGADFIDVEFTETTPPAGGGPSGGRAGAGAGRGRGVRPPPPPRPDRLRFPFLFPMGGRYSSLINQSANLLNLFAFSRSQMGHQSVSVLGRTVQLSQLARVANIIGMAGLAIFAAEKAVGIATGIVSKSTDNIRYYGGFDPNVASASARISIANIRSTMAIAGNPGVAWSAQFAAAGHEAWMAGTARARTAGNIAGNVASGVLQSFYGGTIDAITSLDPARMLAGFIGISGILKVIESLKNSGKYKSGGFNAEFAETLDRITRGQLGHLQAPHTVSHWDTRRGGWERFDRAKP